MQLRSGIAVAVAQAGSYSSSWSPSLGLSICHACGPKKIFFLKNEVHLSLRKTHKEGVVWFSGTKTDKMTTTGS